MATWSNWSCQPTAAVHKAASGLDWRQVSRTKRKSITRFIHNRLYTQQAVDIAADAHLLRFSEIRNPDPY